jgi:predicted RNase H-like HicB family nuclease
MRRKETAMNSEHPIYIAKLEDGSFLAASNREPRFCVGAASEEEVIAKARRAVEFYWGAKARWAAADSG